MWNCSESYSGNATLAWWRVHSVLCGLWNARSPLITSGESHWANSTDDYEDAGPPLPPMGRSVPEGMGEGSTPWFTMNWFCTTGWSVTFGWSGIIPSGVSWVVGSFDEIGKGMAPTYWENIKAGGYYIGVFLLFLTVWMGFDIAMRPLV